jgi:hypothetical protein
MKPDLIIGYEDNGVPVSAVCSSCGEWVDEESLPGKARDTLAKFAERFNDHLRRYHKLQFIN